MKKGFLIGIILAVATLCSACNYQVIDLKYSFSKAQIRMPDGTIIEGALDSWRDYDDGSDQIQITIDGVTYLVHQSNCVLYDRKFEQED